MTRLPRLALVALLGVIASPVYADVDRSPPPGGVYKLKPGIFVAKDMPCGAPPNVAIRRYDGKDISTAHTRDCQARVLSKRKSGYGSQYRVSQSCLDAGAGPAKRFAERQTVDVPDALTFTIKSQGDTTYRYCPTYQLPAGLRKAAM